MSLSSANREPDPLVPAAKVREELGGISDVTLWRWEKDGVIPESVKINKRKYWLRSVVQYIKNPSACTNSERVA